MDSTAKDNAPISTAVDGCGRSFLSLVEVLRNPTRFADQIASDAVLDEFDRFKLWAGNIAAHRKGRRSLDYRLRDAAQLKAETNSLLASLEDALNTAMAIVQGHRLPWDEETFTDSDSDSESSSDGSMHNLQGDTELKQLFVRTKSLITSLMRLSMAIREPAPNRQARSIDKSHFEQHDMWHVQAKFPDAPEYLTERLGRAISSRRQYLTYREVHHDKLKKGIDKLGLEAATTEFTTNSTEATKLQRTDSLAMTGDFDDSVSMTSYATSINATLRAPGLPKEAREKEHYNCPLCFALVAIHTTAAWKRHVYQDLHPYCCTFEDCATADRLYDSRHAWFAHESEAHHSTFQCVEGCSKTFEKEQEFETHIKSMHIDLATAEVYAALKRVSSRAPSMSETRLCQLCAKRMTLRALQKHLGHHHEQLALFALPANLDDTEDEQEREEQGSMSRDEERVSEDEEREGELSDLSDVSEPDEIAGVSSDADVFIDLDTVPLDTIKKALRRLHRYNEEEIERMAQERSHVVVDYAIRLLLLGQQKERSQSSPARQGQVRTSGDASEPDEIVDNPHSQDRFVDETKDKDHISHRTMDDDQSPTPALLSPEEPTASSMLGKDEAEWKKNSQAWVAADLAKHDQMELVQQQALIDKEKFNEQAAEDAKKRAEEAKKLGDEVKLASIERLILAQRDEQLKREEAAEAARKAAKEAADAEAEKIAKEKKVAAADAEETKKVHEKALAEAKAAAEELEKAERATEEEAANFKPSDAPKASINPAQEIGLEQSLESMWAEVDPILKGMFGAKEVGAETEAQRNERLRASGMDERGVANDGNGDTATLSWVVGSNPQELKSRKNMTTVRKRARKGFWERGLDRSKDPRNSVGPNETRRLSLGNEVEQRAIERVKRGAKEKELEEAMRKRLTVSGSNEEQVNEMVHPERRKEHEAETSKSAQSFPQSLPQPTYPKISLEHIAIETLRYYDLPWEFDRDNRYVIILREMNQKETNVLFEHTRRLRSERSG